MAQALGVDTDLAGITGPDDMQDDYGVTLGQASLTVGEQASMLATIADNGVYHDEHVITSITRNGVPTPLMINSALVFNPNPTLNAEQDSQVQYAMSETTNYGTATVAAMSNGQPIIAKTGTTNTAQSAFFVGAIPTQALVVGIFTGNQSGTGPQTLNNLGGQAQGGYGGTWPATIWHTYAENMFVPIGVQQFQQPTFTGGTWNLVPPNLRKAKHKKGNGQNGNGQNPGPQPSSSAGNPNPFPTYTCDPQQVTCSTSTPQPFGGGGGGAPTASGAVAGAAVGGVFTALPIALLWARRRGRRRGARRG
jgi:membrane peptidoglycan carboxypeptidase